MALIIVPSLSRQASKTRARAWLRSAARPLGPGESVEGRDRRCDTSRGGHMGGVFDIKSLLRRRHQQAAIGQMLDNHRRGRRRHKRSKPRAKILDPGLVEVDAAGNRGN